MRVADFVEKIIDGDAESKIILQSSVKDLKVMDGFIAANFTLTSLLEGATLYHSYTDGLNFMMIFCTKKKRFLQVDWCDGYGLTIEEFLLPKGKKLED